MTTLHNWGETREEWKLPLDMGDIPHIDDICESHKDAEDSLDYFLLTRDNAFVYSAIALPINSPENGEEFQAMQDAMNTWDCPHVLYWNPIDQRWSHF